jgi:hypothetical protein
MQRGKLELKLATKRASKRSTKPPSPPPPPPPLPPLPLAPPLSTEEGSIQKKKKKRKKKGSTAEVEEGQLPPPTQSYEVKYSLPPLKDGGKLALSPLNDGAKSSLLPLNDGPNSKIPPLIQFESRSTFLVSIEATEDNLKKAKIISREGAAIVRAGSISLPAGLTSLIEEGLNHRTLTTMRTKSLTLVGTVDSNGTLKTKRRWFCWGRRSSAVAEQQAIAAAIPTKASTKEEGLDKTLAETIRDRVRR